MTKLTQLVAVEKGVRAVVEREVTDQYHLLDKGDTLLNGLTKTYRPRDEEGAQLPSQTQLVQVKVDDVLNTVAKHLTRLFDVTFTKDAANTTTKADIVIDGELPIARDVPIPTLLFLEKQLEDIRSVFRRLPTLDPGETWHDDSASGFWRSEPADTVRTKKIPRAHVLYEATDKHPAQVQSYTEDVVEGYWTTTKFSGAIPRERKVELLARVEKLIEAVKYAREQANLAEVENKQVGASVFAYLLNGD